MLATTVASPLALKAIVLVPSWIWSSGTGTAMLCQSSPTRWRVDERPAVDADRRSGRVERIGVEEHERAGRSLDRMHTRHQQCHRHRTDRVPDTAGRCHHAKVAPPATLASGTS